MIAVSPKLGEFLTQATQTPDIETALWRVVSDYLAMKMEAIDREIAIFEAKWHMSFAEFVGACRNDTLGRDIYSYDIEQDYWAWERATTLKQHYASTR
jgi:hypothetical protein